MKIRLGTNVNTSYQKGEKNPVKSKQKKTNLNRSKTRQTHDTPNQNFGLGFILVFKPNEILLDKSD